MPDATSAIFKLTSQGAGALRNMLKPSAGDVAVPARLVKEYRLVAGATVAGPVRSGKAGLELASIETICGLTPSAFQARTPFVDLVAIDPCERFNLSVTGDPGMRIVDLVAPIGRGTRGLIVSPPKAGKTMLLEQLARVIRADQPDARIVVLLIDERPEELTYFRRAASAEVFASTSDASPREHTDLAELMLAHIRVELECGHDVVVLLDSLTRLVRAFNRQSPASGGGGRSGSRGASRSLSGGLEAGAMEIPRKFFGLARNVENGGSVTLIGTVLVDTNSRMDQLIYEELKGTGNCEIVLDRALAEARLFPAINIKASGTRREELLYSAEELQRIVQLRRALVSRPSKEALPALLKLIEKYPTNDQLLHSDLLPN